MRCNRILLVCVMIGALISTTALAENAAIRAGSVKGSVEQKSAGGWKALKSNDTVSVGTAIRTGADGSAILMWNNGNALKLTPLTSMTIDEAMIDGTKEVSKATLSSGKLFATAKKLSAAGSSFQVKTPTAVAGVRGTDFTAETDGTMSTFKVGDGQIVVDPPSGPPIELNEEFKITISPEQTAPAAPEPMSDAELKEVQQEFNDVKTELDTTTSEEPKEEGAPKEDTADEAINNANDTVQQNQDTTIIEDFVDQLQNSKPGDTIIVIE